MKNFLSEQLKPLHALFSIASHICSPFFKLTDEILNVTGEPSDQVILRFLCRPSQTGLLFFVIVAVKVVSSSSNRVTGDSFVLLHLSNNASIPFISVSETLKILRRVDESVEKKHPGKRKNNILFFA